MMNYDDAMNAGDSPNDNLLATFTSHALARERQAAVLSRRSNTRGANYRRHAWGLG
jgi:hypothetical protein